MFRGVRICVVAAVSVAITLPSFGVAFCTSRSCHAQLASYRRLRSTTNALYSSSSPPPPSSSRNNIEDLPGPDDVTEATIRSLFTLWNYALATGEAKIVAKRYAKDAVLMPSISDEPLMDNASIEAYYEDYIRQKPQKKVLEGRIKIGFGWAEDTGVCEIRLGNPLQKDGSRQGLVPTRARKARYSFVYVWEGTQWKILHHHSSIMREDEENMTVDGRAQSFSAPSRPKVPNSLLSPKKVEHLFQFFNDALDTLDAKAVADRFSQKAVLFPFLRGNDFSGNLGSSSSSSAPRMGSRAIEDYFVGFLREVPQARVLERHVALDPNPNYPTAKDVGTVEWTFQKPNGKTNGKKIAVLARYCLDYVVEGGQWKIAYFQSSPLPEGWMGLAAAGMAGEDANEQRRAAALASLQSRFTRSITEEGVRKLWKSWQAAVDSRDANQVVALYTHQQPPVMMLTLSESPYTTLSSIRDFYQTFLFLRRPSAEIIPESSHVTLPNNIQWCKHVGTMEWTLQKTPTEMEESQQREAGTSSPAMTIKERFSFLYVLEDGEWKISHHMASVHPESLLGTASENPSNSPFVVGMDTSNLAPGFTEEEDGSSSFPKQGPWQ